MRPAVVLPLLLLCGLTGLSAQIWISARGEAPRELTWESLSGRPRFYQEAKTRLGEIVHDFRIPAVALAIVAPGKALYLSQGFCDPLGRRAVTDKTIFRASRLGMLVFNYLILRLEGEGVLELDLPLPLYFRGPLPPESEFAGLAADKRWARLTAKKILVHEDGLGTDPAAGGRPRFYGDPGGDFLFSDAGYRLLQRAVEERTGRSLDVLAEEYVFEPIGMPNSSFDWTRLAGRDFALSETEVPSPSYGEAGIAPDAARSFLTCTNDLARFIQTVYRRAFRLSGQNLASIETAVSRASTRTITDSPGTASAFIRRKRISWSLLGGHFESPWPGAADPYFCPGREAGCENYLVGFPAKSLTFILLGVPSTDGGGYARKILADLFGDVFSPWGWMEYE